MRRPQPCTYVNIMIIHLELMSSFLLSNIELSSYVKIRKLAIIIAICSNYIFRPVECTR